MSQPHVPPQARRVISLGIKAGGAWLVHLGIFAGLLWLSAWMQERPSAAVKATVAPAREDPFPDLPLAYDDSRCSWLSDNVLPFSVDMTRPVLISGETLRYPPEALAARVQGTIIARCTLTCQGEVKSCRIIKGLPLMHQAAIAMLESRRYVPVQAHGRPITVSYVFLFRVPPP